MDLSNYATKADLKNETEVDTSQLASKSDLASLKAEVDKIDVDKLKLSNVVNNEVVKKTVYDKLVAKVSNIDTSGFVLKTKYNTDKTESEKKIPDATDFVKKANLPELENKIPDISNLETKTALSTVENKIPSVSNLVKKQTITQKSLTLKINLIIIIMTNILIL